MVDADADAGARMPLRAALADDDVARNHGLAAELLDAETSASRIATVAGGTACLLVCHGASSLFLVVGLGGLLRRGLLGGLFSRRFGGLGLRGGLLDRCLLRLGFRRRSLVGSRSGGLLGGRLLGCSGLRLGG